MKAKTILNTSGALVTLGGAAVGSYYALNTKSSKPFLNSEKAQGNAKLKQKTNKRISEWLKIKTNKPMLPTNDVKKNDLWGKKWKKFKTWYEKAKEHENWEIFDWVTKKDSGEAYTHLKDLCKINLEKETDDQDKLINEVIEYCIEE